MKKAKRDRKLGCIFDPIELSSLLSHYPRVLEPLLGAGREYRNALLIHEPRLLEKIHVYMEEIAVKVEEDTVGGALV